jgi:hypothetical protein
MEPTIITCPNCGFSKEVPTDKLPVSPVKINCPECKQDYVYNPNKDIPDFVFESEPQPCINAASPDTEKCPVCKGEIKIGAIKCKHCQTVLNELSAVPLSASTTKPCPLCQKPIQPEAIKCKHCWKMLNGTSVQQQVPPPQSFQQAAEQQQIPPGVSGWCWGGFFLSWIWAIGNKTWIGLLGLVPIVNIVMMFVLGAKGRAWAWKNNTWESVEHFNRVQKKMDNLGACTLPDRTGGIYSDNCHTSVFCI